MKYRVNKKNKYGNIPRIRDGHKIQSTAETNRFDQLRLLEKSGEVDLFLRQVPFHIPGGVKYLVDYIVFWSNGEVTFEDVKGRDTQTSIVKRKVVEHFYPVEIELIK